MSAAKAGVVLHPAYVVGEIDRRIFGSFVEHMGRCVYSGIYEPTHPTADGYGFRGDVEGLIRELGVSAVRYPGGNFVSGYDWRDGIGPVAERPTKLDLAWRTVEPNTVGTDEFLHWAARRGLDPMMAVNLGTSGAIEAAELVEYCNLPGGTGLSELRAKYGSPEPHAVRTWCLGNEMDGAWQIGHTSAADYGHRAAEAGKAMRLVDPGIELIACGSSSREMKTFGAWENTVTELALDVVDYMSMHAYYDGLQTRRDYLASGHRLHRFVEDVVATVDAAAARKGSAKRLQIALDEWNVWSSAAEVTPSSAVRELSLTPPRITEEPYLALDAVVLGDLLISILNHTDRIKIACLSLLVNVSAPILTEPAGPATRQPIFHPFAAAAHLATGTSLRTVVDCAPLPTGRHGDVPSVAAAASFDRGAGRGAVFLANRAPEPAEVTLDHRALGGYTPLTARTLLADGEGVLVPLEKVEARPDSTVVVLPAESWTVLEFELDGAW
ncbi:alpha-L-arabinofuranosidase [Actinospica durhamensis]|uniref:non-reducing end alpha-L-arabinofuranosidase n=1 Tax=Actinospica durhamensis TaxID=1508375 RepID=A0A941IUE1_9ACTN|nr:alpha-L-arabinofuranosidase C-terminal domain-containing protein [Actinospica durhamensis]MBR7838962.1 alpha-L-arabinofuranosidase [Actinospica durhamensis]